MCQYMLGKNAGLNFVLAWASIVVFGRWIGFAATRKMRMGRPQQTFRCAADCPVVQVGSGVQSPHFVPVPLCKAHTLDGHIMAHFFESAGARPTPLAPPVHPHVRGDSAAARSARTVAAGSPPRAWGFDKNTLISSVVCETVHPHVRGDSAGRPRPPRRASVHPHVRGDVPVQIVQPHVDRRFTPTCVGTAR